METRKLSRFIARVLRHAPSAAGVMPDEYGWIKVDDLLSGVNNSGRQIDFDLLCDIVATDEKGRFAFNEDRTMIRANQGHTIDVDLQMPERVPPDILYHGTAVKYIESIRKSGLIKKTRQFVHLSKDVQTAIDVGARHGTPIVLAVDCKSMVERGLKFYISANGVWQTDNVPAEFLTEIDT